MKINSKAFCDKRCVGEDKKCMKNIFIEGIQGAGKSTLVNALSSKVLKLHVCREGDYSPVELAWCTWMSKEEYDAALKRYENLKDEIIKHTAKEQEHYIVTYTRIITDVPNFHKEMEELEIYNGRKTLSELKEIVFTRYKAFAENGYLFECSFFQNIVEDLILFHQLEDDEIVEFYRELFECVKREDFLLLYLYSDKIEENIKTIKAERSDNEGNEMWYPLMLKYLICSPYGQKHNYSGFEDMIAHFKHRQELELRIIKEVIRDNAVILPAKEWDIEDVVRLVRKDYEM